MLRREWFWIGISGFAMSILTVEPSPNCFGQSDQPKPAIIEEGRRSKLGVVVRTVPNGAVILYVVKDSPAWKAGLENGDRIVSVDGFTVGVIDGLEYPLQSEIRRVKGTGVFRIVDKRTGKVVTKNIKLTDDKEDMEPPPPPSASKLEIRISPKHP